MNQQIFFLVVDNILAGIAAFIAIIVWVKTRDISWIFIVLSVLSQYVGVIYNTLEFFGIVLGGVVMIGNIDMIEVLLRYLPLILLGTALTIKAVKNMSR